MWSEDVFSIIKCASLQQSVVDIIAGGVISPHAVSMVLEVIIRPSNWFDGGVGRESPQEQLCFQLIHTHADLMCATTVACCIRSLLKICNDLMTSFWLQRTCHAEQLPELSQGENGKEFFFLPKKMRKQILQYWRGKKKLREVVQCVATLKYKLTQS